LAEQLAALQAKLEAKKIRQKKLNAQNKLAHKDFVENDLIKVIRRNPLEGNVMHTRRWINNNSSTLIGTQSGELSQQHSPEAKSSHLILPGQTIPAPRKNQS